MKMSKQCNHLYSPVKLKQYIFFRSTYALKALKRVISACTNNHQLQWLSALKHTMLEHRWKCFSSKPAQHSMHDKALPFSLLLFYSFISHFLISATQPRYFECCVIAQYGAAKQNPNILTIMIQIQDDL